MKDILNYYYQMIIDDNVGDNGYFSYHNHLFCLYEYHRNINEVEALTSLNKLMLMNKIPINKIIKNNLNQVLTNYDNKNYVLIEIKYECNSLDNVRFIMAFNDKKLNIINRNNWGYLWSQKIDYIEYQMKHIENSYPIIHESINYYIGLAENAISYFNMLDLTQVPLYFEHRRSNLDDIYNPLELVIDYKVRDIGEYIKKSFFNQEIDIIEVKKYLNKLNLNAIDYLLLYIRLIYPSYYFDIYERIINNNLDENKLLDIIKLSSGYEKLLYEVYLLIKEKTNVIGIEWINKKYN